MCVIFVCDKVRPTDDMVERGYEANPSGAGIAWQEDGRVRWEKGLTVTEAKQYAAEVPLPYVLHFRIPSCGASVAQLCHPFPIADGVPLDVSSPQGGFDGKVLFHNGHWGQWKSATFEACVRKNLRLPEGKWSDTRAMAWSAFLYGTSVLELIDEKTVVFGPADIEIFGSGWKKINDIWCSNDHWESRNRGSHWHGGGSSYYPNNGGQTQWLCAVGPCNKHRYANTNYCFEHQPKTDDKDKKGGQGGSTPETTFPAGQGALPQGSTEQQKVQEGPEGVRGVANGTGGGDKEGKETPVTPSSPQKLLGPAPRPEQHGGMGRGGSRGSSRDGLVVAGDTAEDWREIRRWVRSLQDRTPPPPKYQPTDDEDRAARKAERERGMIRQGPL